MNLPLGFLGPLIGNHPLITPFLFLLLFGFTIPISEEIALAFVGVTARNAGTPFLTIAALAVAALILADLGYYGLARFAGPKLLRVKFISRIVKPGGVEDGERYFHRRGPRIIFICRFVAGLRLPALLSAGFLRMPLRKFVIYDMAALVIGVPVWLRSRPCPRGAARQRGWLDREGPRDRKGIMAAVITSVLIYRSVKADRARADAEQFESEGEE